MTRLEAIALIMVAAGVAAADLDATTRHNGARQVAQALRALGVQPYEVHAAAAWMRALL